MYTFFKDFYQNEIFYAVGKVIKSFGESDQNTFSEKVCKYDQIYQIIVFGQIFTPFLSDSTKLHFWWIWLSRNNLGGLGNYWQSLEAFVDFLLLFQFVDLSLKNWRNGRKFLWALFTHHENFSIIVSKSWCEVLACHYICKLRLLQRKYKVSNPVASCLEFEFRRKRWIRDEN